MMGGSGRIDRRAVLSLLSAGAVAAGGIGVGAQQPRTAKPRLAPGRPRSGGVVVALIGGGVDYTRAEIVQRLARDGEGEAIALDTIDGDRLPFEAGDAASGSAAHAGTAAADAMLGEVPAASLVPVRVAPGDARGLLAALAFVASTPVRVALVAHGGESRDGPFAEAAQRAPDLLLVAPAGFGPASRDDRLQSDATATAIVVTACDASGAIVTGAGRGRRVDVAVPLIVAPDAAGTAGAVLEVMAAARVAALAARISHIEPKLRGAALRERVLGLATPLPSAGTLSGWISEVGSIHR